MYFSYINHFSKSFFFGRSTVLTKEITSLAKLLVLTDEICYDNRVVWKFRLCFKGSILLMQITLISEDQSALHFFPEFLEAQTHFTNLFFQNVYIVEHFIEILEYITFLHLLRNTNQTAR
jgi:hypothetical protein